MYSRLLLLFLIFLVVEKSTQDESDNTIDDVYVEAVKEAVHGNGMDNLGGMLNSFVQSDSGKQLGSMLMGAAAGNNQDTTNQILQGIGSLMQNSGDGGGLNPALLGSVLGALNSGGNDQQSDSVGSLFSLLGGMMQGGGAESVANLLPTLLQSIGSFTGPEAKKRMKEHEAHSRYIPPFLEDIHLLLDNFVHSPIGQMAIDFLGAQKVIKVFADKEGKFSAKRVAELLENQSFRRHWIKMCTEKIASIVSYFADPQTQARYMSSVQFLLNSFLKSQGYPKSALFDPSKPTETISGLINYTSKKFFNTAFNSKPYVSPIVKYIQDLLRLAQSKVFLIKSGVDSRELTNKLTDTLNLEIIEPVAKVYRAYRFARKVPQCDRYVMCLVNQPEPEEQYSLPTIRSLLSKGTSIFASWFLSSDTGTSFWALYHVITEENNCQARFLDNCNDFHIEEIKVTTEYVHNEL